MTLTPEELTAARERDRRERLDSIARLGNQIEREAGEDPEYYSRQKPQPGCVLTRRDLDHLPNRPPEAEVADARMIITNLEGPDLAALMNDIGWTRYSARRYDRNADDDASAG